MTVQGDILRLYIENQKLNKTDFAKSLGMSRQNLYQLFTSNTLSEDTIEKIETHLDKKWKEIELHVRESSLVPKEEQTSYTEKRRRNKSAHSPYMVPLIPVKAQAGYVRAMDQSTFLDTLEQYALPPGVQPQGAVWRYWEIEGDSMEPVFRNGDIILTSQVPQMDWDQLRNFYSYVIVTNDRVLFKRVFCKNLVEWVLISENEENYPQQLLPIEYIKEVWVYRKSIKTDAAPSKEFKIKV